MFIKLPGRLRPWHEKRSRLRSADLYQMYVPRTRTNYGDRSFSVNGPAAWNSLPVDLRAPDISIDSFKNQLKSFLFTTIYLLRICGLGEFSVLQMSLLLYAFSVYQDLVTVVDIFYSYPGVCLSFVRLLIYSCWDPTFYF